VKQTEKDHTMNDEEKKPDAAKPVRFVLPRGLSAEEITKHVQELLAKHGHAAQEPAGDKGDEELTTG
jgi:hypothetical protein